MKITLWVAPHRFEDAWDAFEGGIPGRCAFPLCEAPANDVKHLEYGEHPYEEHPKLPEVCRNCGLTFDLCQGIQED